MNAVTFGKSLKSVEMMSVEYLMVVFDGFDTLELKYLANYATISHLAVFCTFYIGKGSKSYSAFYRPVPTLRGR